MEVTLDTIPSWRNVSESKPPNIVRQFADIRLGLKKAEQRNSWRSLINQLRRKKRRQNVADLHGVLVEKRNNRKEKQRSFFKDFSTYLLRKERRKQLLVEKVEITHEFAQPNVNLPIGGLLSIIPETKLPKPSFVNEDLYTFELIPVDVVLSVNNLQNITSIVLPEPKPVPIIPIVEQEPEIEEQHQEEESEISVLEINHEEEEEKPEEAIEQPLSPREEEDYMQIKVVKRFSTHKIIGAVNEVDPIFLDQESFLTDLFPSFNFLDGIEQKMFEKEKEDIVILSEDTTTETPVEVVRDEIPNQEAEIDLFNSLGHILHSTVFDSFYSPANNIRTSEKPKNISKLTKGTQVALEQQRKQNEEALFNIIEDTRQQRIWIDEKEEEPETPVPSISKKPKVFITPNRDETISQGEDLLDTPAPGQNEGSSLSESYDIIQIEETLFTGEKVLEELNTHLDEVLEQTITAFL